MALYQRGSQGPEVTTIQTRLQELGLYAGPLDGDFGGGSESTVKAFQRAKGLEVDGKVGPATWGALFGNAQIDEPAITKAPIERRCLAFTASFETGQAPPEWFAGPSCWVEDVRTRKLTIASGEATVHGRFYQLQWQYGIGSTPA